MMFNGRLVVGNGDDIIVDDDIVLGEIDSRFHKYCIHCYNLFVYTAHYWETCTSRENSNSYFKHYEGLCKCGPNYRKLAHVFRYI